LFTQVIVVVRTHFQKCHYNNANCAGTAQAAALERRLMAFILEAIAEKAEQAERRADFDAVAEARYARIVATGKTIPWQDMRAYLEARMAGKAVKRPVARKLARLKVSRIELAPEVVEDFDRILDHLARHEVENPGQRIGEIIAAVEILEQNPLIGRPVANAKRELVIGRRSHGYVALYRYVPRLIRCSCWRSAASARPATPSGILPDKATRPRARRAGTGAVACLRPYHTGRAAIIASAASASSGLPKW
jgi:toxin ParE1/3/4